MVILTALPEQSIISGLAHAIDFYYWKGIPVARTWPNKPVGKRAPAVQPYIDLFSYAMHQAPTLPKNVKKAYIELASGTALRWQDFLVRCYINGSLI